ncbi:hypothetical protein [Hoeflea prorocentri]|uniref:Uncharacterized protein n=1 Tax=Hoeflea prorocentri TaxID=1922333 RepID=A0A9X3UN43_9HYPH|nr:hypothetical protein [Hoeflea prorocentri]MCY6383435.1 hypothetical protein [Hoeflea prorocentri]MDA5401235.1 hypothetical protein [Hoeflea prorocentri]
MNAVERWISATIRDSLNQSAPIVSMRLGRTAKDWFKLQRQDESGWLRFTLGAGVPTDKILDRLKSRGLGHVDILQINVPGTALKTLGKLDIQRLSPKFIRIRKKHLPGADVAAAARHLKQNGYRVEWIAKELVAIRIAAAPDSRLLTEAHADYPRPVPAHDAAVYVMSMNTPKQFGLWLNSVKQACPDLLSCRTLVLQDNSTNPTTQAEYDALCKTFGFSVLRSGNLGIMGGRRNAARHFDNLEQAKGMFWFEDDMLLHASDAPLCKNGFRSHVPGLVETASAILEREQLGYLMLSFTEFFGDHHLNWAWYHLSNEERQKDFPEGTFPSTIENSGIENHTSYLVGNVHFDNWPSYVSRDFNREMFLTDEPETSQEGHFMARAYRLVRTGKFRAGVLLASPINHSRHFLYDTDERIE